MFKNMQGGGLENPLPPLEISLRGFLGGIPPPRYLKAGRGYKGVEPL